MRPDNGPADLLLGRLEPRAGDPAGVDLLQSRHLPSFRWRSRRWAVRNGSEVCVPNVCARSGKDASVTEKPSSITTVGIVQMFLASAFAVWLVSAPALFAWPTRPAETAMFIGAGFIGRVYIGYDLFRARHWDMLRWQVVANYAFLAFVWLATLWHMDEMNWKSSFWVAHVWALAYTIEPVVLFLWEPKGLLPRELLPEGWREGPVRAETKQVAMVGLVAAVTLAGLMMINPGFMNTRWPWPLDPFNCRVMSAFLALNAGWCYSIYVADDWAEVKKAAIGIELFLISQFAVWLVLVRRFDPNRHNGYVYGALLAGFALALGYCHVRQTGERARLA